MPARVCSLIQKCVLRAGPVAAEHAEKLSPQTPLAVPLSFLLFIESFALFIVRLGFLQEL